MIKTNRQLSPPNLFDYATFVYVVFFTTSIFAIIIRTDQVIPIISSGLFFIVAVLINVLRNKWHQKVWINTYMFTINGKAYFLSAIKNDIDYLADLIRESES